MQVKMRKFSLALITGATSGIGWALSHLLADQNISLILSGRDGERLEALRSELAFKVPVITVKADLLKDRALLVETIHSHVPDLVINNAGYGLYGDALTYETQQQIDLLTVNANAVVELTLESARTLISLEKKGTVLNVASAAAFETMPAFAVYAAAKSCVVKFSEALDYETASHGVRILTACPGMVDTNFRERAASGTPQVKERGMTPQFAAEQIWRQIVNEKRIHVFDWTYKVARFLSNYILPKKFVARYVYSKIISRVKKRYFIKNCLF